MYEHRHNNNNNNNNYNNNNNNNNVFIGVRPGAFGFRNFQP